MPWLAILRGVAGGRIGAALLAVALTLAVDRGLILPDAVVQVCGDMLDGLAVAKP